MIRKMTEAQPRVAARGKSVAAAMRAQAPFRMPPTSGIQQQGDHWVMWWDDEDGGRHTSASLPYPVAREMLTEWRRRAALAEESSPRSEW